MTNDDPKWLKWSLITIGVGFLALMVVVPVVAVFAEALSGGVVAYFKHLGEADTRDAVMLTLIVAPTAVVLNTLFGVAAAWAFSRIRFWGRTALLTLLDLPFSISPVVAGLLFVLLFGLEGVFGSWMKERGFQFLFTPWAMIAATMFVTLPFVARELIPVLEAIGPEEELAAVSLGANGWQLFRRITLPNIKWGLLYGVLLCNARAMGEFGAVYIVGGRTSGETLTMPLQVEQLFQGFDTAGAFALATVLTSLGLVTLALKTWVESKSAHLKSDSPEKGT